MNKIYKKELAHFLFGMLILLISITIVGYRNYQRAHFEIMKSDRTDMDIEVILNKYNFDTNWYETPGIVDYFKSGWSTLWEN